MFKKINFFKISALLIAIFNSRIVESKIRLMTFHYNRPDFLEMQCKCLNKFLKENNDYELIVFNDAVDLQLQQEIENVCKRYNAQCVIFPQHLHHTGKLLEKMKEFNFDGSNGTIRHCQLVQYALEMYGYNHNDIIGIFEGDVFLTREFSLRDALKNYDFISAMQTDRNQQGLEYMWIGLCFFDVKNLPHKETLNFDAHFHNDTFFLDSGGNTYYYLLNNPQVTVDKHFRLPIGTLPYDNRAKLEILGFNTKEVNFLEKMATYTMENEFVSLEFHLNNRFLHYGWSRYSDSDDYKPKLFKDFLNDILE